MSLRSIEFILQEAFTGIRRNGLMAFASISTIALSLGVLGGFVLIAIGANNVTKREIGRFEVDAFVSKEDGPQLPQIVEQIRDIPGVGSVAVMDRDREWAENRRAQPNISTAGLLGNPLPYKLVLTVTDHMRNLAISAKVRTIAGVDKVNDGAETLGRLMAVARVVKVLSVAGVIVLLVTAAFIISNAIKLTLYARRREIRIMQLVGATNWLIRIPLVIEGIVFGAVGAFAAWVLLQLGSIYLVHAARTIVPFLSQFSSDARPEQLAAVLLMLGTAIGAAGSLVSIRRFLHD